jgi:hypothetical protein
MLLSANAIAFCMDSSQFGFQDKFASCCEGSDLNTAYGRAKRRRHDNLSAKTVDFNIGKVACKGVHYRSDTNSCRGKNVQDLSPEWPIRYYVAAGYQTKRGIFPTSLKIV